MFSSLDGTVRTGRANIMARRHAVSAGHYLATQAAFQILEAGGNAVDAGVAGGIVLNVVEGHHCGFAGVAPIMIRIAATGEIITIDGLGTWPSKASAEYFTDQGLTVLPEGILQTVVPGAPDSWLTALARYGTMSLADVASVAIDLARNGFPVSAEMSRKLHNTLSDYPDGSAAAAVFLPQGRSPLPGDVLVQSDLADTLQFLIDSEAASASVSREAGIIAARNAFYLGDIAKRICDFQATNGGWLTREDMARYHVSIELPAMVEWQGLKVYACGPWSQGPLFLQTIMLLRNHDLVRMGHNSANYVHTLTEAIKLAAADREAFYGDPRFVDVPLKELLSEQYARDRAGLIDAARASPGMPAAGNPRGHTSAAANAPAPLPVDPEHHDTQYICVIDGEGNAFSATPSDPVMRKSPMVPGTGLVPSARGIQSRLDPNHPACMAPGKRPRLTPNPAIVIKAGEFVMPFGTPGGDMQTQAMTQVFLNMFAFDLDPQAAVESPRFYSSSFPDSFAPHGYHPGLLHLEDGFDQTVISRLTELGHKAERDPRQSWPPTSVCVVFHDLRRQLLLGAADCRKTAFALGR